MQETNRMNKIRHQNPNAETVIPLCVPHLAGKEWDYIKECLDTNWVSSVGPFVDRFEACLAHYTGNRFAVATMNGTAALHIALLVVGVEPGDEVLVSDLTFIAPVNAIRYVGAWPVLVDAEPAYFQMDPDKLKNFLSRDCRRGKHGLRNRHTGRLVKAILPVHILGHSCDMNSIMELAEKYGIVVIEDATESLGGRYHEKKVGHLGHCACLSFNGNKIITTGGGGMFVSDDEKLSAKARYLTTQAKDDPLEFIHNEIGYNYRLTNVLAALGCAQMEHLDEYVDLKRRHALAYAAGLAGLSGITLPLEAPAVQSTFWLYTIRVNREHYGCDSRPLLKYLESKGIQSRPLWQPMHQSLVHRESWSTDCSVAEQLNYESLSIPSSVGLSEEQSNRVIAEIELFTGNTQHSKHD